jgi:hypothetical protein
VIYVNRAPLLWYLKRQNTVETSTNGFEFIASKNALEMIEGLQYKLRMMGVQVDGLTNVFCDNKLVGLWLGDDQAQGRNQSVFGGPVPAFAVAF